MPHGKVKILKANHTGIILETVMGSKGRFAIPKAVRHHVKVGEKVRVTIEKIERKEKGE